MDVQGDVPSNSGAQEYEDSHGPGKVKREPNAGGEGDDSGPTDYQLTELKTMGKSDGSISALESPLEELAEEERSNQGGRSNLTDETFQLQLIEAVSRNPCLYNPDDEFHGSKHQSAEVRGQVWKKIAKEVHWTEDLHGLQMLWKRLRDKFVRKLRRNGGIVNEDRHDNDPLFDAMRWLIPFITTHFSGAPPTSQSQGQSREYYVEPHSMGHDVMISGYQNNQQNSRMPNQGGSVEAIRTTSGSTSGYYIVRNPSGSGGQAFRFVNSNNEMQSGISSTSRVTVLPATRSTNGNTTVLHLQPANSGQVPRNSPRVHIIQSGSSNYERVSPNETPVTSSSNIKKDSEGSSSMAMVLDSSPHYYNGNQKMFRLVNVNENEKMNEWKPEGQGIQGPPRKRMILTRGQGAQSQIGEEVIIDDGIQERTVVIDQDDPDSPLLSESPLASMMISGHQVVNPRHQNISQRVMPSSHLMQHHQIGEPGLAASPTSHPGYLQQSQYDADLAFQQLISSSLARYDDDMKALMKFNIQRILLEARYGAGACNRIIQEEELNETAASSVVAHEMVTQ